MTATLERRLARLELQLAPPPPPSDDGLPEWDEERWWGAAPVAVQRYIATIDAAMIARGLLPLDDDANFAEALAWEREHHPHLRAVFRAVEDRAAKDEPCPLGAVQHAILAESFDRLHAHYREHLPSGGIPHQWIDATWRDGFGRGGLRGWHAADTDKTGATWVEIWRASGTTAPAVRALMGLHEAELALLAADE